MNGAVVAHWDDAETFRADLGHLGGTWRDLGRAAGSRAVGLKRIEIHPGSTSMIAWPRLSATNGIPAMLRRNATSRAKNIASAPTSIPVRARRSNRLMYGTIRRVVVVAPSPFT